MAEEIEKNASKSGPRWQRKKEDRPQEILDAAVELFVQQGFAATKVSQIARKAGVTPGTLYVYYKNKEAILQEVVMKTLSPIFYDADSILHNYTGSAKDLVSILIEKWWDAVGGESKISGIPKLISAEASNFPELSDFYRKNILIPGYNYIRLVLEYGIKTGEFQMVNVRAVAYAMMSAFHGAVLDAHSFKIGVLNGVQVGDFKGMFRDLLLHGILNTK